MNVEKADNSSATGYVLKDVDMFKYLATYFTRDGTLMLKFEEKLKWVHQGIGILKNILE